MVGVELLAGVEAVGAAPGGVEGQVIADLLLMVLMAGGIGLLVYAGLRELRPLWRWGSMGNVFTGPLRLVDLCIAAVVLGYYALAVGRDGGGGVEEMREAVEGGRGIEVMVVLNALIWQVMVAGLLVFYLGFLRRIDLDEYFGLRRMKLGQVFRWGFGLVVVVVYPAMLVGAGLNAHLMARAGLEAVRQLPVEMMLSGESVVTKGLLVVTAVVGAPLVEELVFRGFLYPVVKKYTERYFATVFTAAIFAVAHQTLGAVLPLFVLGMMFALAFEWSGSLLLPVAMHSMFNLVQVVMIFALGDGEMGGGGATGLVWFW